MNPNDDTKDRLEIHKLLSEELRHTATVIWQFSIAIVTLQGGAVALSTKTGFETVLGKCVIETGFFLSVCFSVMLLRQAYERGGFIRRICAVEEDLSKVYPEFRIEIPKKLGSFTSVTLAWILLLESVFAFLLFLWYLVSAVFVFDFFLPSCLNFAKCPMFTFLMAPGACLPLTSSTTNPCKLSSDCVLFWVLQVGLVLFVLFALLRNWIAARNAGRGGLAMQINRGPESMDYFFVIYTAIIGPAVAICASVDVSGVKGHRILWILGDTAAVVYVCLFNGWFRNHLLRFVRYLSERERR